MVDGLGPLTARGADQFGKPERWQRLLPKSAGPGTQVSRIGQAACVEPGAGHSGAEEDGKLMYGTAFGSKT